ncbi:oligosaccharide flippase family protein (plasmid) [Roseobacteraceae bacterium NS-SX3]
MLSRSAALAVGAVTLLASSAFKQGLGLITLAVTARLLTPDDFGIIAFFLIAVLLVEMLQRQVPMVLIRLPEVTPAHLDTVLTIQALLSLALGALFCGLAPLAGLLGLEELAGLLPALLAITLLMALRSPRIVLFERGLKFNMAAGEEAVARTVYAVTAVVLAWLWRDFWAIVAANFMAQLTRTVWTFSMAPMRLRPSLARWHDCLGFSSWTVAAQLAQFFAQNLPQMMIGASLGLAAGGLFRVGNRFVGLVTSQAFSPLERVLYPGLADSARESGQRAEVFARLNQLVIAIILPAAVGMALVADHLIVVIAGPQWLEAAPVIWILAPLKALETIHANVRAASYVGGTPRALLRRNLILLAATALLMGGGVQFGFHGALAGAGLASLTGLGLSLAMAGHFGARSLFEPLLVAWRSLLACAAMAAAVLLVKSGFGSTEEVGWAFGRREDVPLLRYIFLTKVLTGITVYTAVHILLWRLAGRPEGFESYALALPGRLFGHAKSRRAGRKEQQGGAAR